MEQQFDVVIGERPPPNQEHADARPPGLLEQAPRLGLGSDEVVSVAHLRKRYCATPVRVMRVYSQRSPTHSMVIEASPPGGRR